MVAHALDLQELYVPYLDVLGHFQPEGLFRVGAAPDRATETLADTDKSLVQWERRFHSRCQSSLALETAEIDEFALFLKEPLNTSVPFFVRNRLSLAQQFHQGDDHRL